MHELIFTPELIRKKRDGYALTSADIHQLVRGYVDETVTDYQMSAWAMAVFFQGMTPDETCALTFAMRDSGVVMDLADVPGLKVDKHSTGGVGDKVSICLAPLVAACGVPVPMVCGRGLGHTGGTVDKLEAIAGFRTQLSPSEFSDQLRTVGCAIMGQTEQLAPADKKLYALRDVTATVESIPLITASILSKKLAEGIDALVMDVKVGKGAFMKTLSDAKRLASSLVRVATLGGIRISALLTDMSAPLGRTIGNALEVEEACAVLRGDGPADVLENTLALGAEMLVLGDVVKTSSAARKQLLDALRSGAALRKLEEIIDAQGGLADVARNPARLPRAPHVKTLTAARAGYVSSIDAFEMGIAATQLGAGRMTKGDIIDPGAGITLLVKPGDRVASGQAIATLHTSDSHRIAPVALRMAHAFRFASRRPAKRALVLHTLRA